MKRAQMTAIFLFSSVLVLLISFIGTNQRVEHTELEKQAKKEQIQLKIEKQEQLAEKAKKEQLQKENDEAIAAAEKELKEAEEKKKAAEENARIAEENRINRMRLPVDCYTTAEYDNQDSIHTIPHDGLDFGCSWGSQIFPAAKGEVIFAGNGGELNGCGNWAAIYHSHYDVTTIYCHMAEWPSVTVGQFVDPDTSIGLVGDTGYSFGSHLHFGTYWGRGWYNHYNPRDFLSSGGLTP